MNRTERRRLVKQELWPLMQRMLEEFDRKGDAPPADVWVSEDVVMKIELVKVV
jgi:hypothetical protein